MPIKKTKVETPESLRARAEETKKRVEDKRKQEQSERERKEAQEKLRGGIFKEPQKYFVGGTEVNKEEYDIARGKLGFSRPGIPPLLDRKTTPKVEKAIAEGFKPPTEKVKQLLAERAAQPQEEITPISPEIVQPPLEEVKAPIEQPILAPEEIPEEKIDIIKGYKDVQEMIKEGKIVAGTVPIGGIPVGGTVIAANVAKTKIAAIMASKAVTVLSKAAAWAVALYGVKTVLDIPEKKMTDVLAELRIMKQEGRTNTKMILLGPEFALDVLDNIDKNRQALDEYERAIQEQQSRSFQGRALGYGKFGETQLFIESLRRYFIAIEQLAARSAVGGAVSPEEISLLLQETEGST